MEVSRSIVKTLLSALAVLLLLGVVAPSRVEGSKLDDREALRLVDDLDSSDPSVRAAARARILESGDRSLAPALVELIFFSRNGRDDANDILTALLGEDVDRNDKSHGYRGWLEVIGRHEEIVPKNGYAEYKARQYARIDPAFAVWLGPKVPATIRLEEIVFGGVRKDGIPALTLPPHVRVEKAGYLRDQDVVFGAVVGREARAYPQRLAASHEIVNDVVGGRAVTLAFCTLCKSAILYDASPQGGQALTFGTSGLLYRSNKLMFDRQTNSLWSQLLGEPVVGPLVGRGLKLEVLPIVVTTWSDWKSIHPESTVLSAATGFNRDYAAPYADYFASPELMFPVWKRSDALGLKESVWIVETHGARKAYPLETLFERGVVNDRVGDTNVVVIGDRTTGSVRAWARGDHRFERTDGPTVRDERGTEYRISGEAMGPVDGTAGLEFLAGYEAYWFGWFAANPDADLYRGE